jgi:hypothetical protein
MRHRSRPVGRVAVVGVATPPPSGGTDYAGYTPTLYAYVTDLGNGSGSSEANAMDLPTALSTVAAGGIIGVLPGTYTGTNTNSRVTPAWLVPASGTESQPITVVAKYPASTNVGGSVSELRGGGTVNGSGCPAFGVLNQSWVNWIGFYVSEFNSTTTTDTGCVNIWSAFDCSIRRCHILMNDGYIPEDNKPAIRVENTSRNVIADNLIVDADGPAGFGDNQAAIETYVTGNLTIENNHFLNCGCAIHTKSNSEFDNNGFTPTEWRGPITIRKNLFTNNARSIATGRCYSGYDNPVYQNIFNGLRKSDGQHMYFRYYEPEAGITTGDEIKRFKFQNNTFYTNGSEHIHFIPGTTLGLGNAFWNNICAGTSQNIVYTEGGGGQEFDQTTWDAEHNCYHGYTGFGNIAMAGVTLAQYKSTYGQDSASPAAINSDPLFTNAASGDFTLQGGSPCLTLGRDLLGLSGTVNATIPAGAYITGTEVIGVRP